MIKVLHYSNQLGIGGTERTMESFCRHLDRNQFQVYAASWWQYQPKWEWLRLKIGALLGHKKSVAKLKSKSQANMRVGNFRDLLGNRLKLLNKQEELIRWVEEEKFDILHVHTSGRGEFPTDQAAFLKKFRAVVTTNQFELKNTTDGAFHISKILFVSHCLWREKATWAKNDSRADVLYNPIESPLTKSDLRSQLGIPRSAFVFGRTGRADSGIHDPISLNAYQRIQNDQTYFLALSAPENMIAQAKELNLKNFISLPATTDSYYLSSFYNTIDVLAHARRDGETFGLNLAEAMIHGKPAISHLCAYMNAQLETIGNGGVVVSMGDVDAYSAAMLKFMTDSSYYEKMAQNARHRAKSVFSAQVITKKLEEIYLSLLV